MIKLISSQSDRPPSQRFDEAFPTAPPDGGTAVESAGRTVEADALRKLLILVETAPHDFSRDLWREAASRR